MKLRFLFPAAVLALCCIHANHSHAQVTFDWATVGNPGNAGDVQSQGTFGSVANTYRISKHEVTNSQYTEFLNAVADADPNGLYNSSMASDARAGILRSGTSGSFSYSVKPGQGNNPVVYVSFFDAMRFTNWLENGQPIGAQMSGTTEDGVYTIGTGASETRAAGATYFIPSEDEWYKAAYHKNDGVTGNYWDYPTSTDSVPYSDQPPGSDAPTMSNTANIFKDDGMGNSYDDGFAVTGSGTFDNAQNYLTDVGAYTTSTSPYGTFDQGGNAGEWNEAVISQSARGIRGGSWGSFFSSLAAPIRNSRRPGAPELNRIGFRVASIPEPSSGLLLLLATVGLLMREGR